MRLSHSSLIWLIALLVCSGACAASAGAISPTHPEVLQRFTEEDGLPLNSLTSVLQARNGYLWIASSGGLVRFDGSKFTSIPSLAQPLVLEAPATEIDGLPSIRILELMEDAHGRIWIGTQDSGINLYDQGRLLQLDTCGGGCQINQFVWHEGQVLVATDAGLFRVDPVTLHSETLLDGDGIVVQSLAFDHAGNGFMLVNGAFAILEGWEPWLYEMPVNVARPGRLLPAEHGILMFAASGLHVYSSSTGQWRFHDIGHVQGVDRMADGTSLVGTDHGDIIRLDAEGVPETLMDVAPISPRRITQDTEGNLWITTRANGLVRVRSSWIGTLADPAAGMNIPARGAASDGDGGFWFALGCDALRHWKSDGSIERHDIPGDAMDQCVETLLLDRTDALWAGTAHGKVLRWPRDGRMETIKRWPGHQPVRALFDAGDGGMLMATGRNTYALHLTSDGIPQGQPRSIAALEGLVVRQIVASRREGIWFVGEHGAVRLHQGRIVERWGPEEGLSSRFARALHEDADGTLWIATYGGGLNRIANGKVDVYRRTNGLFDDALSCIFEDADNRLWLGGNRGITLVLPETATPDSIQSLGFGSAQGLPTPEVNGGHQSSCFADEHGRFLLALVEGFAVLEPQRYAETPRPPPLAYIERISVDGTERRIEDRLDLDVTSRNIEIGFTAIQLSAPERLRFRFRLTDVDAGWIDAGTSRSIVYPTIPWGTHTFQVQARLEGEPWPGTWAELKIERPAPWYQRPWVWLVCTLLALLLLLDSTWQRVTIEPQEKPPAQ